MERQSWMTKVAKKYLDKIISNIKKIIPNYTQGKDSLNLSDRNYSPTKNQVATLCTLDQNQTFFGVDIIKTKRFFCHAPADNRTST